jgi:hypothetical protein
LRESSRPRRATANYKPFNEEELRTLDFDLPQCRVAVLSRRVVLPPSDGAAIGLEADVGAGLQRFVLSLEVVPAVD